MSVVSEKLASKRFRETYAQQKRHYELLDEQAVQKPLSTKLHPILQLVLSVMLKELGFKSRPELTLAIDECWEPTPDVCGIIRRRRAAYLAGILSALARLTSIVLTSDTPVQAEFLALIHPTSRFGTSRLCRKLQDRPSIGLPFMCYVSEPPQLEPKLAVQP